jgi:hypothetical protein
MRYGLTAGVALVISWCTATSIEVGVATGRGSDCRGLEQIHNRHPKNKSTNLVQTHTIVLSAATQYLAIVGAPSPRRQRPDSSMGGPHIWCRGADGSVRA